MNLMNIMLRKKRDIKVQLYRYIYIKFKNRQNSSKMLTEYWLIFGEVNDWEKA